MKSIFEPYSQGFSLFPICVVGRPYWVSIPIVSEPRHHRDGRSVLLKESLQNTGCLWECKMREEVYDFIAQNEENHWWYNSRRVIFMSVLQKTLPPFSRDERIYDIGCGGGGNFTVWSSFSDFCIGVDVSEKALHSCRKFAYKGLLLTDAGDLSKITSNDASLVTLCDVIEHVEDDKRVFEEAYRILKTGGFFFVTA